MRLVILTIGSRGDVQPYLALAQGLMRAGHRVRLATHRNFQTFIEAHGVEFYPLEGDPAAIMESRAGQAWLDSGQNSLRFWLGFLRVAGGTLERVFADSWEACRGADAVLHSSLAYAAYHIAEKLEIPAMMCSLQPMSRSREIPSLAAPRLPVLGSAYNLLTHWMEEQGLWQPFRARINRWRRDRLGLPAMPFWGPFGRLARQRYPILYGFSRHLLPRPSDWDPRIQVTGYWFLQDQSGWQPSPALLDFLRDGPAPVYIGFGSMIDRRAQELADTAARALAQAGARGVLLSGWSGMGRQLNSDRIFTLESADHAWLFPRMAAIVHHGGAGTTGQALRSGVPSVVVPFFADQPFWAAQVYRLGAGPRPIPRKRLSASSLAAAIRTALQDESLRARAARLGELVRAEDGVGQAVGAIERHLIRAANTPPAGQQV